LKQVERTGNNVLTVDKLSIGYGEKILASGIEISLHRGEVLGIIGGNGTGKTTFLKTILGELRELFGTVMWGTKTNFGYYSQNLEGLEPRNEVIQELRRVAPMADGGELRSFLARFLFFGEDVFKSVGDLSGGEKGRLALAKLIYSHKNVLVLDEPTNHLDIPAREALEAALEQYDGTIITVSHDRFFLDKIATQILSFEDDGRVESYSGNYTEFHDWKAGRLPQTVASGHGLTVDSVSTQGARVKSALSKNQVERIEKRIAEIESIIASEEETIARSTIEMSDPSVSADPGRLKEIGRAIEAAEMRIRELTSEWERLSLELESDTEQH
jgi:ATP-binding cassette subfamily F protein 3